MAEATWVADASSMAPIREAIEHVTAAWQAGAQLSLLLLGESGSGKGAVAAELARRLQWPLARLDCSARGDMLRVDLMGHARGAFTGASGVRPGVAARARAGILLLDEVGDLDDAGQRVLRDLLSSEQTYTPVGSDEQVALAARVVAATNRDLLSDVKAGRFRADLYYRLAQRVVEMPPLRERADDLLALARGAAARSPLGVSVDADAEAALRGYDWPGNVRELESIIGCCAAAAGRDGIITAAALEAELLRRRAARSIGADRAGSTAEQRRAGIAAALAQGEPLRARDLAERFGVSAQTIRSDLRKIGASPLGVRSRAKYCKPFANGLQTVCEESSGPHGEPG